MIIVYGSFYTIVYTVKMGTWGVRLVLRNKVSCLGLESLFMSCVSHVVSSQLNKTDDAATTKMFTHTVRLKKYSQNIFWAMTKHSHTDDYVLVNYTFSMNQC